MAKKGKKYVDALKRFDAGVFHTPDQAIELVRSLASAGFDETVELVVRLGVDPRKADQVVRGTVALPSGTGTDVRVAVFAAGEAANEARAAGADLVGADDLLAEVEGGRRGDLHSRSHAPGGQARSCARPPWADAEPQDGHRDH